MGLQFLWECSKDASSHRDVTWYDVYFGKGAELKEMQNIVIETWNYPYNENENLNYIKYQIVSWRTFERTGSKEKVARAGASSLQISNKK